MSDQPQLLPEAPAAEATMKRARIFTGCDYFSCQLQASASAPDGKTVFQAACYASLVVSAQHFSITTLKEVTPPP